MTPVFVLIVSVVFAIVPGAAMLVLVVAGQRARMKARSDRAFGGAHVLALIGAGALLVIAVFAIGLVAALASMSDLGG